VRNELFLIAGIKPLKSLGALNRPFRGFLRYQGVGANLISPRFGLFLAVRPKRSEMISEKQYQLPTELARHCCLPVACPP
jgi:hypothetical protein